MLCHQHPTSNKYLDMEDPRRAGMIVVVLLVFVVVQVGQLHLDRLDRGLVGWS